MTTASSSSSITNDHRNARPPGNKDQFQPSTNGLSTTTAPSQQLRSAIIGGLSLPANLAFREKLTENRTFVSGKIWAPGGKPPVFTYRKENAPLWALFYELAKTFQIAGIDFPSEDRALLQISAQPSPGRPAVWSEGVSGRILRPHAKWIELIRRASNIFFGPLERVSYEVVTNLLCMARF